MAVVTWNPRRRLAQMEAEMDRLFGNVLSYTAQPSAGSTFAPAMEIYQTEDALVVNAVLPGLKEEDLELTIVGEQFTLRGKVEPAAWPEDKKRVFYLAERRYGTFARTLALPFPVDSAQAQAHLENGVLTVTLPKAAEARPHVIRINGQQPLIETTAAPKNGSGKQRT